MNENIKILIVEDDECINNMLATLLTKDGYSIVQVYSGTEAMLHINSNDFQMILLDLMLPGMAGEELLQNIRKNKQMPVIIISAKIDRQTKIGLLKMGADDYITKPFDMEEVSARIYSNLRRYIELNNRNISEEKIIYRDITLNNETKEVYVNNKKVILTAREFEILQLLLKHPKKVYSKANLFESIWGDQYLGDDNTVNVHMSNLRNKLCKANPEEEYIETIWGMGYKLKTI